VSVVRRVGPPAPHANAGGGPGAPPTRPEALPEPSPPEEPATTVEALREAFQALSARYGQELDALTDAYNRVYDGVIAQPSPQGERRLERLYREITMKQEALYRRTRKAWERLYAQWQALMAKTDQEAAQVLRQAQQR
jgi:predicted aminopeptidase